MIKQRQIPGTTLDIYVMIWDDDIGCDLVTTAHVITTRRQPVSFFPGIAMDQTSGRVAVSWYDCRNDKSLTNTQFFTAVSTDGFPSRPRNFQLEATSSYSHQSSCTYDANALNYGDYSGLAFHGGYFFPTWCSYGNVTDYCGDVHTCRIAW